jgi:hypothetical protein
MGRDISEIGGARTMDIMRSDFLRMKSIPSFILYDTTMRFAAGDFLCTDLTDPLTITVTHAISPLPYVHKP